MDLFAIGDGIAASLEKAVADLFAHGQPLPAIKVVLIRTANVADQEVQPELALRRGAAQRLHLTEGGVDFALQTAAAVPIPGAVFQVGDGARRSVVEEGAVSFRDGVRGVDRRFRGAGPSAEEQQERQSEKNRERRKRGGIHGGKDAATVPGQDVPSTPPKGQVDPATRHPKFFFAR